MSTSLESFFLNPEPASLTVLDGSLAAVTCRFPMNPKSWDDNQDIKWVHHAVVGRSHPKSHWTGGTPRELPFDLELDSRNTTLQSTRLGVVFRGTRSKRSITPIRNAAVEGAPLRIGNSGRVGALVQVLNFFKALRYPRSATRTSFGDVNQYASPPLVLFQWGRFFRLRCICVKADISLTRFAPDASPTAATIKVILHHQPLRSVSWDQMFTYGDLFSPGEGVLV